MTKKNTKKTKPNHSNVRRSKRLQYDAIVKEEINFNHHMSLKDEYTPTKINTNDTPSTKNNPIILSDGSMSKQMKGKTIACFNDQTEKVKNPSIIRKLSLGSDYSMWTSFNERTCSANSKSSVAKTVGKQQNMSNGQNNCFNTLGKSEELFATDADFTLKLHTTATHVDGVNIKSTIDDDQEEVVELIKDIISKSDSLFRHYTTTMIRNNHEIRHLQSIKTQREDELRDLELTISRLESSRTELNKETNNDIISLHQISHDDVDEVYDNISNEIEPQIRIWASNKDKNTYTVIPSSLGEITCRDIRSLLVGKYISVSVVNLYISKLMRENNFSDVNNCSVFITDTIDTVNWNNDINRRIQFCLIGIVINNLPNKNQLMLPIYHHARQHYTILHFDKMMGVWSHIDSFMPKHEPELGVCFREASNVHRKITGLLKRLKEDYSKWSVKFGIKDATGVTSDMKKWLSRIDFSSTIRISSDIPQQELFSWNSGIFILFIMENVCAGKNINSICSVSDLPSIRPKLLEEIYKLHEPV